MSETKAEIDWKRKNKLIEANGEWLFRIILILALILFILAMCVMTDNAVEQFNQCKILGGITDDFITYNECYFEVNGELVKKDIIKLNGEWRVVGWMTKS